MVRRRRKGFGHRQRFRGRAERQRHCLLPDRAEMRQRGVMPGGRDKRDARWQAIAAEIAGQRQRTEIRQVGEIGVIAEVRVVAHWLRVHFFKRMNGRRGRDDQRVHGLQHLRNLAGERGAGIFRLPGVAGRIFQAALHDAAYGRVHHLRRLVEHLAHRHCAFRHPRALIELLRKLAKRREIDRHQRDAERLQTRQALAVRRLAAGVAIKFGRVGHGKTRLSGQSRGRGARVGARVGIGGVITARKACHLEGIGGAKREDGDAVVQAARGHYAVIRQPAFGGFEANNVIKTGRDAPGARGVGAERESDQPARHG
ncbi:hypothetical protein BN132_549 [Cronobacter turicensis 564]|nr:hypothetical protein BN132_549 [Cronobacter turicensis 564]